MTHLLAIVITEIADPSRMVDIEPDEGFSLGLYSPQRHRQTVLIL